MAQSTDWTALPLFLFGILGFPGFLWFLETRIKMPHWLYASIGATTLLLMLSAIFICAIQWGWLDMHEYDRGSLIATLLIGACIGMILGGGVWRLSSFRYQESVPRLDLTKPRLDLTKIQLYERYRNDWENHRNGSNDPIRITDILLRKQFTPAPDTTRISLVLGNELDGITIQASVHIVVTINSIKVTLVPQSGVWQAMIESPTVYQQYHAIIPSQIPPGNIVFGPTESLVLKFPIGTYEVDFFVQGQTHDYRKFELRKHARIEIYEKAASPEPKKKPSVPRKKKPAILPLDTVMMMIEERRSVGDMVLPLRDVATIWHGNDGRASLSERWSWNAKFRRLKKAVNEGRIRGVNLNSDGEAYTETKGNIVDLIKYFKSYKT